MMKSNQCYTGEKELYYGAWHCKNPESTPAWLRCICTVGSGMECSQRGWPTMTFVFILKCLKQDRKPMYSRENLSWPLPLFLRIMEAVPQAIRPVWHGNCPRVPHPSCFLTQILFAKPSRHPCMGTMDVQGPIYALQDNPWPIENRKWWIDVSVFLPPGG